MNEIGKTLDDFRAAHDPSYVRMDPLQRLDRPLDPGCEVFVITSAQNGTPVHEDFLACLENYCEARRAELLIVPLRYKNGTSIFTASQKNLEWWTAPTRPYLWNQRLQLHPKLTLLADIKTQPTAVSPLSGFDAVSGDSSGILGHTKLQMKTIATPHGRMAKILTTTGCVTVENYTDTKTGKIGGFHHSYSALVVELDGPRFHLRQLHYSRTSKRIIDLETAYSAKRVYRAPPAHALVCGDTHVRFIDPAVEAATYRGPKSIVGRVRPKHIIQHDLLDGHSVNPHHKGNLLHGVSKRSADRDSIKDEAFEACEFIVRNTPAGTVAVVVDSNHDDFLSRAAITAMDVGFAKFGAANTEFLLETALMLVRGAKQTEKGTEYPDAFVEWLKKWVVGKNVRTLKSDESFMLGGVELSMHGHQGPNGARGSRKNLSRIGVKSIIGHSHSPGIEEGCYQTGTSTRLRLEYNTGASSWLNTHCLLNADGKRQLINIIDGHWRI